MAPISRAFPARTQTVAAGTGGDDDYGDFDSDGDEDGSYALGVLTNDGGSCGDDGGGVLDPGDSGVDMDGIEGGPQPDGSDWDEIPTPALLFGDACPCVRYPRWRGHRA